jgi:hypothetical protein
MKKNYSKVTLPPVMKAEEFLKGGLKARRDYILPWKFIANVKRFEVELREYDPRFEKYDVLKRLPPSIKSSP